MVRPYSNDLRERVVAAVAAGQSCRVAAERFDIAVSSVVKWSQRYRATGSVAPGKMGGHRRRILEPHRAFIVERIAQTSRSYLSRIPWAHEEDAERAVRAGLDIIGVAAKLFTPTKNRLNVRIGVATDIVDVGDLSGHGRRRWWNAQFGGSTRLNSFCGGATGACALFCSAWPGEPDRTQIDGSKAQRRYDAQKRQIIKEAKHSQIWRDRSCQPCLPTSGVRTCLARVLTQFDGIGSPQT